jgi:hypothetical protein
LAGRSFGELGAEVGALTPDAVIRIVRPEDGPLVYVAAP